MKGVIIVIAFYFVMLVFKICFPNTLADYMGIRLNSMMEKETAIFVRCPSTYKVINEY